MSDILKGKSYILSLITSLGQDNAIQIKPKQRSWLKKITLIQGQNKTQLTGKIFPQLVLARGSSEEDFSVLVGIKSPVRFLKRHINQIWHTADCSIKSPRWSWFVSSGQMNFLLRRLEMVNCFSNFLIEDFSCVMDHKLYPNNKVF